jgi:hypothetical protein
MARCEVCDLELDVVERFCPGCGVPAPRHIVEVSTGLRESFHGAAADDVDTEYAFGSKRLVKTAPPPPPAARKRPPKAQQPAPPAPEPAAEPAPVREPEPEVAPDAEPEPVVAEIEDVPSAEDEDVASVEDEPDDPDIELVADVEISEEEPAPQDEVPEEDDGATAMGVDVVPGAEDEADVGAAEVDEVPNDATDVEAAPIRLAPSIAEPGRVTPYVVLPPRRAVAVREREVVVEEAPEPEAPRPSRWKAAVLVFVVVVAVAGAAAYVLAARQLAPVGAPFTAQAQDGSISLDAPAGWRLEARGAGVLGIGQAAHDTHVHATAIRRSALADGLTLKRRADEVHEEFVASLDDAAASRPETTNVGPHTAIRQVLSTDSVIYVHTVVKMPKYFVNVLAWTSAERFNTEQDTLLGVVGTLQSSG